MTDPDPVHEDGGKWYFYYETWHNRAGPFESEAIARHRLNLYCHVLKYGPTPAQFEIGKCYLHLSGKMMKIVGSADTTLWGAALVGECASEHGHELVPISADKSPDVTDGWFEVPEDLWKVNFK